MVIDPSWAPRSSLFRADSDYFSLGVRQALHAPDEPDTYLDDPLAGVSGPDEAELLGEFAALADHPDVIAADMAVTQAEEAVLSAEEAGVTDELAMRRLDQARAAKRTVLVRLQKQRAAGHTQRAVSRVAQVVPLRRFAVIEGGAAA